MDDFCDISRAEPSFYAMHQSELQEIDRLKWLESEKRGYDIGIHYARWLWITAYRKAWWDSLRAIGTGANANTESR